MLTQQDVERLKTQVEFAMEVLLRAADERVSWKQVDDPSDSNGPAYAFLPGAYVSVPRPVLPQQQDSENEPSVKTPSRSTSMARAASVFMAPTAAVATMETVSEGDGSKIRLLLHGDNTFEYEWSMRRNGARAMEYTLEMEGSWGKPVLNRTRRGEDDQRVFLTTKRIRFQRLSNYDSENGTWKLCLKTLTRHGSDWASVGLTERGIPPIVLVFQCRNGCLESTGAALPAQILSNSPACRILAGLTKKIANKLGAPVDVMTEKWLPARNVCLAPSEDSSGASVRRFNPFYCLAEALRNESCSTTTDTAQVTQD